MKKPRAAGRPAGHDRPAYLALAEILRKQLLSGRPGAFPSLRQLAKRHEVGVNTARAAVQVLRREGRLGINLGRRLVAVRRRSPDPEMTAAGVLLEVLNTPLDRCWRNAEWAELQRGIETEAGVQGFPLTVVHSYALRNALPYGFLEQGVRGVILSGPFGRSALEEYARLPVPVVLADEPAGRHPLHCVAVENERAAREATEQLLRAGHRRIACLRSVSLTQRGVSPDSQERQAGFAAAFAAQKVRLRKGDAVNILPRDHAGSPVFRRIASKASGYTAALCTSAGIARRLAEALRSAGRSVPTEFAIACFQGVQGSMPFPGPRVDFFEMGREAVRMSTLPRRPAVLRRVPCRLA